MPELPLEISVFDLKALMDRGEKLLLLDVREPGEFEFSHIEGSLLMPMGTVAQNVTSLEAQTKTIIAICHHGVRSLNVTVWLRQNGVNRVRSLAGGIDAWSRQVDSSVPRY